jgi:hypothetical protein
VQTGRMGDGSPASRAAAIRIPAFTITICPSLSGFHDRDPDPFTSTIVFHDHFHLRFLSEGISVLGRFKAVAARGARGRSRTREP